MTRGQIAQLQELSKCYGLPRGDKAFVQIWLEPFGWGPPAMKMDEYYKAQLRRLTHQYMPQIKAMRKNRKMITPAKGSKDKPYSDTYRIMLMGG